MILVDTCVLPDLVQDDPRWAEWSESELERAAARGPLLINPIVYFEFSVYYDAIETCERTLREFGVTLEELPREALFLAGKAFRQYRARRGARANVLPDFFIGAHAAVREIPILTRDAARIRAYFPDVALILPKQA